MDGEQKRIVELRTGVIERLKRVLTGSLNLDLEPIEIHEDCALFGIGLGLDSIDALQFVVGVESEFDLMMPSESLVLYRSLNSVADYLLSNLPENSLTPERASA